jgi:hypothetical protein
LTTAALTAAALTALALLWPSTLLLLAARPPPSGPVGGKGPGAGGGPARLEINKRKGDRAYGIGPRGRRGARRGRLRAYNCRSRSPLQPIAAHCSPLQPVIAHYTLQPITAHSPLAMPIAGLTAPFPWKDKGGGWGAGRAASGAPPRRVEGIEVISPRTKSPSAHSIAWTASWNSPYASHLP